MSGETDPIRHLRPQGPNPQPTRQERDAAERRLRTAIANELKRSARLRALSRWVPTVAVMGTIVLALSTIRQTPAQAVLIEIAEAARRAEPLEVPAGEFLYVQSETTELAVRPGSDFDLEIESVGYLRIGTREVWRNEDEQFLQIQTTIRQTTFFDEAAAAAYVDLGLDQIDGVGETRTEQFTGVVDELVETQWPTDAAELQAVMEEAIANSDDGRPQNAQILDLAADLVRETNPSPALRAALLEVLSRFGFGIVRSQENTVLSVEYSDPLAIRYEVTISRVGQLLGERVVLLEPDPELGLPIDTAIFSAAYSLPTTKLNLG